MVASRSSTRRRLTPQPPQPRTRVSPSTPTLFRPTGHTRPPCTATARRVPVHVQQCGEGLCSGVVTGGADLARRAGHVVVVQGTDDFLHPSCRA
jgi:hypothetical protein